VVVGVLQVELRIDWAESLKDKRRVVRSVKDRLHREHMVSVAEVGALENPTVALLGIAAIGSDGQRIAETLDRVSAKLHALHDADVAATRRELIHGRPAEETEPEAPPTPTTPAGAIDESDALARELLERGLEGGGND